MFTRRIFPAATRLGAVLLAAIAAPAFPQSFWPGVVDTVEVRAPLPEPGAELRRRAGFATIIPLGVEAPAGRDLADLLDRTAGIQVHRYGGLGAFAQAGVRGSAPGQVLVCLDGVPVASAGDGFVDLALLPVSLFGHAEVYRGAQTASFGGPPAAGVINLVTPAALATPLRVTTGGGSFSTGYARGLWGGSRGPAALYLAAQARRSDGDFDYRDRNGTYFGNTADDRTVARANNDFRDRSVLGKGSLRWPFAAGAGGSGLLRSLRLDAVVEHLNREGGVPGTESVQTRETRFRTGRTRAELTGSGVVPARVPVRFEAAWHQERIRDRFDNPSGEVGLSRAATDDRTREGGGRAALRWSLAPIRQELRASWQGRSEHWTPRDRMRGTAGFTRTRRHRSLAFEDHLALGRLAVDGSYHWATARDNYGGAVSIWGRPAEAGPTRTQRFEGAVFGAKLDCGGGLLLKANRGRMARFPSFPELFGQNGVQEGNPGLRSEAGGQWDAGLAWSPAASWRGEAAYFESLTRDKITLLQNSQRTVKAMNLDRAWVRGVESSLFARRDLPGGAALELTAGHTWQEARDVGRSLTYRGKELPNLPAHEGYAALRWSRGRWELGWDLSARSAHFRDRYNSETKRSAASAVHGASIGRAFLHPALRLRAEAQNLFDRRVEDIDGFPLPGRVLQAEITWTREEGGRDVE